MHEPDAVLFRVLTKLLYHVRWQAVRPSLAFPENMQVITRSWAANTPVDGAQHSNLGKPELRGADVEQRSKLPRVGNRAVDHVLEAHEQCCGCERLHDAGDGKQSKRLRCQAAHRAGRRRLRR